VEDADEALRPIAEQVASSLAAAEDAHRALARYLARLEAEPDRLAEVKGRLAAIRALQRKHRVASAEELRELHAAKKAELEELLGREEHEQEAAREVARRAAAWREAAAKLTRAREGARGKLARELEKALRRLDLPHARAEWELAALPEAADEGPPPGAAHGAEQPRLLFSANPGEPPRPVGEVASGGELSRLLLACLRRGGGGAGTLVLDEVDAGLSGRAAKAVGEELRALGEARQVLCISHQAAIAARAHRHFLIEKASRGGATATTVELLDAAGRREEVARLLDGAQSGKARELAEELLLKAG
jgi:DNA repair protein RecN (Recombination protein N)